MCKIVVRFAFLLLVIATHLIGQSTARPNVLLITGNPAPTGGVFSTFGQIALNDSGAVVFNACTAGGNTQGGIFVLQAGTIKSIVVSGQRYRDTPYKFVGFRSPMINSQGDILFFASLNNGKTGLFLRQADTIMAIAAQGDKVPGIPDSFFLRFGDYHLATSGSVVFTARYLTLTHGARQALFLYSEGVCRPLFAPQPGRPFVTFPSNPDSPTISEDGTIIFTDGTSIARGGPAVGSVIYRLAAGVLSRIAGHGDIPRDASEHLSTAGGFGVSFPSSNIHRLTAFVAQVTRDDRNFESALFLSSVDGSVPIMRTGDPAPGASGHFAGFANTKLRDSGVLTFTATVDTGAPDIADRYLPALYSVFKESATLIAIKGMALQSTMSHIITVDTLTSHDCNTRGEIVFIARSASVPPEYAVCSTN